MQQLQNSGAKIQKTGSNSKLVTNTNNSYLTPTRMSNKKMESPNNLSKISNTSFTS